MKSSIRPPNHPDLSPNHEATILWELFREVPRATDLTGRLQDFRQKLANAETAADHLRAALKKPADNASLDAAFKRSGETCAACHKRYRDR